MSQTQFNMAEQIARAAIAFEQRRTGSHIPKSVTVVLSEGTLVVTLHDALSPAERMLARSPAGAVQMQEYHRQLFASGSDTLRQEIRRITGMDVREATCEVEPVSGVVHAFTTGNVVQVFSLDGTAPTESWTGNCAVRVAVTRSPSSGLRCRTTSGPTAEGISSIQNFLIFSRSHIHHRGRGHEP